MSRASREADAVARAEEAAAREEAAEARHRERMIVAGEVLALLRDVTEGQKTLVEHATAKPVVNYLDLSGAAKVRSPGFIAPVPSAKSQCFGPRVKGDESRGGKLTITPATETSPHGAHLRVSMPSQVTTQVDGARVELARAVVRTSERGSGRATIARTPRPAVGENGPWSFTITQADYFPRSQSDTEPLPLVEGVDIFGLPAEARKALTRYANDVMRAEYATFDEAVAGAIAAVRTLDSWAKDADAPRRALEEAGRALVAEARKTVEAPRVA